MSVPVGNYQGIKNETMLCKHGIKTSGMPAWDDTNDNGGVWVVVEFLRKLP